MKMNVQVILKSALVALLSLVASIRADAQRAVRPSAETKAIKQRIASLCGPQMRGRGYVGRGAERAAGYIARQLQEMGLDSVYTQMYSFPVNTFPGAVSLKLGKREAVPGVDFLVDAASAPFAGEGERIKTVDLLKYASALPTASAESPLPLPPARVRLLKNADSAKKLLADPRSLPDVLPRGAYIIPTRGKMTWTVSTDTTANGATIFYVQDSALPRRVRRADATVGAEWEAATRQQNVIGMIRGTEVPDSFVVFTAHYDHLGMMGKGTVFPGASDNASGTAAVLWLAGHFAAARPRYSVLFIFFSGEEAGLLGSRWYTQHPTVPLERMRMLVNLDIMGDASGGVTAVNATEFPPQFATLTRLADSAGVTVKSRGKAANSDHYFFSEAGVPAFFLYSNGGAGYYHDVFDAPKTLSLAGVDGVVKLLVRFAGAVMGE